MPLKKTLKSLRRQLARRRFESELNDELQFHIEMQTTKNLQRGLPPDEARARAEREFGRVERYKDEVRDVRGMTGLDDVTRDFRFAFRALRRSPVFVGIAVLCLGLGIGANAALFSVVNAVLLSPLPYAEADRLVRIYETQRDMTGSVSDPNFRDWQEQTTGFEQLAAYSRGNRNLFDPSEPERISTVEVSEGTFEMLRARPLLGRVFRGDEMVPGSAPVVVLSEAFWRHRFSSSPSAIGESIVLDGTSHTIIGVMPGSFEYPVGNASPAVWLPYIPAANAQTTRGARFLNVVGRLKPEVSLEQAAAQLREVAARLEQEYPNTNNERSVLVVPLREQIIGRARPALYVLLGAVGLVLLIACANVANLLLARAATRRHEVAVRLALGASRGRVVRQFLVESVLLSLLGAIAGALFAWWSLGILGTLVEGALPRIGRVQLDATVFAFLLGVALLTGILSGLIPALQLAGSSPRDGMAAGGAKSSSNRSQNRFRGALVVAEVALSLVLLVGAGLLLRGFVKLSGVEPGLVATNVLTAQLAIPARSGAEGPRDVAGQLLHPALERIREQPGVQSAAAISMLPIQSAFTNAGYSVVGDEPREDSGTQLVEFRMSSPGFFETLSVPLLAGRDFNESDGLDGEPVTIVNAAFVRRHFPDGQALGRQLRTFNTDFTIIGVVGDMRQAGLDRAPLREMYLPYRMTVLQPFIREMTLVVKSAIPPAVLTPMVRDAVRAADPGQPIYNVQTMEEVISRSLAERRLSMLLLAIFAGVALLLSAAGLYGVIAYVVAQRTREIGVRVALGAQSGDVVRLVLRQGVLLTGIGLLLGLAGALALTRFLQGMLYGVSARDPLVFGALATLLAAVAMLATWLPARRAARVDPLLAIRSD